MSLSYEQLKNHLAALDPFHGWDFSNVRDARDPLPWDYEALVARYVNPTHRVLDVGTGGAERFLRMAPAEGYGLGVDENPAMIAQARANRQVGKASHLKSHIAESQIAESQMGESQGGVDFAVMKAENLALPDASFDVVLNRHSAVFVDEVMRVLRPGGVFITQQVARNNTLSILSAFGWTPESFGPGWWQPVDALGAAFEAAGAHVVAQCAYDVRYWFLDVPSLLLWLTAVPLPESFDLERHWQGVNRILDRHTTPRGIETNEYRELLIIRAP